MAMTRGTAENNLIVFIAVDDMTKMSLLRGAQFGAPLKTPGIDWLASEWTWFENMQAVVPVCRPSRAAMMMSQPPNVTQVWHNESEDSHDNGIDWTLSWPARLKRRGQVDAIGKLTHGFYPAETIRNAAFTRYHRIRDDSLVEAEIVSQSGISGTPGQVFTQVRFWPDAAAASSAYGTVTLNAAGTAVESVVFTEFLEEGATTPRFPVGVSGAGFEIGDTLGIRGLGLDPVTGIYSMPDATLEMRVTKRATFKDYDDQGSFGYGTFTEAATKLPGDEVSLRWFRDVYLPELVASNDQSFRVAMIGHYGSHTPWIPEQRYLDMYPLADISIPTGYDEPSAWVLRFLEKAAATAMFNAGKLEEAAQYYLAAITQDLDRVGAIFDAVKAAGMWDRTTFVLWSDHSYQLGNQNSDALPQGIDAKFQPYGTATHCLCAIRIPGVGNGAVIREPVSSLDIGPTILAAAGVAIPAGMYGQSLLPAMRKPLSWTNARAAVSVCMGNMSAVKACTYGGARQVFRIIRYFNGEEYLYNETADPLNMTSLHASVPHAAVLAEMQAALATELTRWGLVSGTTGGTGNDLFRAYALASLTGGAGNDTYIIGDSGTTITEAGGGGTDAVVFMPSDQADSTFTQPENVEYLFLDETIEMPVDVTANSTGTSVSGPLASFTGGAGDDYVRGRTTAGNTQDTTITGGAGDDYLQGGTSDDNIDGGNDDDTVKGGGGDDTLLGGAGNDSITGSAGNDGLFGGDGADTARGGAGDDTLGASIGADLYYGGSGADSLAGGDDADTLVAGPGADTLVGGAAADLLYGGQNNDTLEGGSGNDTLQGDEGVASYTGGTGADHYRVSGKSGNITITDFSIADGDVVVFKPNIGFGQVGVAPATLLASINAAAVNSGADSVITVPGSGSTVRLTGVLKAAYVEAMFTIEDFGEDIDDEEDDEEEGD